MKARESRPHPGEGEKRLNISAGDLDTSTVDDDRRRCRKCGHVIWTPVSVLTGLGTDCRRAVARAAREVAA